MNESLYLKASSIIETVIAITIITICSLIATLVYTNVIQQTPPIKKHEYAFRMEKEIQETIVNRNTIPYNKKFDGYSIEKRVDPFGSTRNLKKITFLLKNKKDTLKYSIVLFNSNDAED